MPKKILVTGAAGFIGSHATEELLSRGNVVVGIDNLNDYYPSDRKRANLLEIQAGPDSDRFSFRFGDIRDTDFLNGLFEEERFDSVVHLAAMAGVRVSIEEPQLYFDVNLSGTLNLVLASVETSVENLVFASTSSAYGNTEIIPFVESDVCDRPLAPYAASKRAAEMLLYTYYHLFGLQSTVLRFFTVYGPRGRPDMMAYKVLDNIFFKKPVKLFNGGEMWRDWTYVSDIAKGVANAVERPLGYEVLNLGRGEMVKLADFVSLIESLCGARSSLDSAPKLAADIDRSFASIEKARRDIDYSPSVSVEEGIESFWAWYRETVLEAGRPAPGKVK